MQTRSKSQLPVVKVRVDDYKRVRLPDAQPGTTYLYENHGDGRITLTEMKERFPPGSLAKYITRKRNKQLREIFEGISLAAERCK